MKHQTIAILGCGSIGRRHIANLRALGYDSLILFDADEKAAKNAAAEFGAIAECDLDGVWGRQPLLTLVCTPPDSHVKLAMHAVQCGSNLFIEKPVSHNLDGLAALESHLKRRGLMCMVGCNMRFHPGIRAVRRVLAEGTIGVPIAARFHTGSYLPRWRPGLDYRNGFSADPHLGGAHLECIHEIDLALWLLGPARLHSSLARPAAALGIGAIGIVEMLLEHDSDVISSVHLNFVQRNYHRSLELIGSTGSVAWDFGRRCVNVFGPDGALIRDIPTDPNWDINDMYLDEILELLDSIRIGRTTTNPIQEAACTLGIALRAADRRAAA